MKNKYITTVLFSWMVVFSLCGQSIDSLLELSYINNAELKALKLDYEAAMAKAPQVNQLPNPVLGVGLPILRPETRLGSQALIVSASQNLPWFGTLDAKEDVLISMAKTKYETYLNEKRNLQYTVKNAYFNLYFLTEKQNILRKNIKIYEVLERLTVSQVSTGQKIASDVLSVQIKLEGLKNRIQILEKQKKEYVGEIEVSINDVNKESFELKKDTIQLVDISIDIDVIRESLMLNHPLIKRLDWQIEKSDKELVLNKLMDKPTFMVGLDYSIVKARTDLQPSNNGRDILIPKVSVSIPVYKKKFEAKIVEERALQEMYNERKDQKVNEMISLIQTYFAQYESALLMNELVKKQMVLSKSSFEILLAEYSSKGNRFDELMKIQDNIIQYEIEILNSTLLTNFAKIKIDRLTDYKNN